MVQAKNIIIATGSSPMVVSGFEFDKQQILSSTGALAMKELPESMVILGGGAIGCEFAFILNCFGVKVTLIEALPHILPAEDQDFCVVLRDVFRQRGIEVMESTRAKGVEKGSASVTITVEADGKTETREAIYAEPQVASFGLTEAEAIKQGIDYKKSVFKYPGAGKSVAVGKPEGLVKVLSDATTGELLAAHIVGHDATEIIHQPLQVKHSELLADDVTEMIHAHPTISETVLEAMRGIDGEAVHG